jgi:hypothetical protein
MPVAWQQLTIPGVPAEFALSREEVDAPLPLQRFHRRIIALLDAGAGESDSLALVDKAMPHARYDLMMSEASARDKPTPMDVCSATGETLWRTGAAFVRFVSEPEHRMAFGLDGGQLHLAMNCDPATRDRESVQAAKQFHLHLLYWTARELEPLRSADRAGRCSDGRLTRQLLDPMSFLGARIIRESLAGMPLGIDGASVLAEDVDAVCAGLRPLGCLIRLPGWAVLELPAFEALIRRLHARLQETGAALQAAFTGAGEPPPAWHRHALLPLAEIDRRVRRLGYSSGAADGLVALAARLRDLPPRSASVLRHAAPGARKHCMTLNQPCYSLNLHAPVHNGPRTPLIDADGVYLIVQTKLFSGTGGAGLLTLNGIPSVRVMRGRGAFSERAWRGRADFQRAFAQYALRKSGIDAGDATVRRLLDFERGWV